MPAVCSQLAVGGSSWTPEYSDPEQYILKYPIAGATNKYWGQELYWKHCSILSPSKVVT